VYRDEVRARAYADLGFPATDHLAFRDIPSLIRAHTRGTEALDFGCGAGRSTRFLRRQGFHVTGVDISPRMLARARKRHPGGRYVLVPDDGRLGALRAKTFDPVLSAFTFDNIPGREKRVGLPLSRSLSREPGGPGGRARADRHPRRGGSASGAGHPVDRRGGAFRNPPGCLRVEGRAARAPPGPYLTPLSRSSR
jgi:SAM-dependent methyltransferase